MQVFWGDVGAAAAAVSAQYPVVRGLVAIRRPKVRTGVRQNNVQFATVECPLLAALLLWLSAGLSDSERQQRIFPAGSAEFLKYWKAALAACNCTARAVIPAGLRAGGATHHYLLHLDVPRLRRRGR